MINWPLILLFYILPCNDQAIGDSIVTVTVPEIIVQAGNSGTINVQVSIKKGYHIQANKVNDEFIIPTTIEIDGREIITTGEQLFPESKKFKLEGTADNLFVYDGNFRIAIPFKTEEKAQKGKYKFEAKLHYQACDAKTCFFPKTVVFLVTIRIV